jgi:hypothetical protein
MMWRMERKKTGRPPKPGGPRIARTYRLPAQLVEAIEEYADKHGMHQVDLVGQSLADKLGVPYTPQQLPLDPEGRRLNKAS